MTDKKAQDDTLSDADLAITLGLLSAVEREDQVTQRSLASELGIALGLANSYLKRAARKGWIKVQQVPPNRYSYFLTPQGFSEKARLTGEYLTSSLTFFRRAKDQVGMALTDFSDRDYHRVVLFGVSELAEIAALCALGMDIELVGIVDPFSGKDRFAGLPVARRVEDLPAAEAYLVTDVRRSQSCYDDLVARYGRNRVAAPRLLHIRQKPVAAADHGDEGRAL